MVLYVTVPGMESGYHVFFALLAALSAAIMFGMLYKSSNNTKMIKYLSLGVAVFVWLSWILVAPVYVNDYGADKAIIKAYPETANAHKLGMETKEHIFYTGLLLATIIPITTYSVDLTKNSSRKLLLWLLATLLIGFIIMDAFGAWIGISAKYAWSIKAGA